MNQQENELIIEQIQIGPMQNFTYIVGSRSTREVALVDPAWNVEALLEHVDEQDYKVTSALITHYHPDHCGGEFSGKTVAGIADLIGKRPVPVYAHKTEAAGVVKVTGISDTDIVKVDSGDRMSIGDIEVEFLHTPGHTPGSQCFRIKNTLVSGDTLFIDGCGRVDLPGSDTEDMFHSLQKLSTLPDDTLVLPGHNYSAVPNATLGQTKQQYAYLRIPDLESWKRLMG